MKPSVCVFVTRAASSVCPRTLNTERYGCVINVLIAAAAHLGRPPCVREVAAACSFQHIRRGASIQRRHGLERDIRGADLKQKHQVLSTFHVLAVLIKKKKRASAVLRLIAVSQTGAK